MAPTRSPKASGSVSRRRASRSSTVSASPSGKTTPTPTASSPKRRACRVKKQPRKKGANWLEDEERDLVAGRRRRITHERIATFLNDRYKNDRSHLACRLHLCKMKKEGRFVDDPEWMDAFLLGRVSQRTHSTRTTGGEPRPLVPAPAPAPAYPRPQSYGNAYGVASTLGSRSAQVEQEEQMHYRQAQHAGQYAQAPQGCQTARPLPVLPAPYQSGPPASTQYMPPGFGSLRQPAAYGWTPVHPAAPYAAPHDAGSYHQALQHPARYYPTPQQSATQSPAPTDASVLRRDQAAQGRVNSSGESSVPAATTDSPAQASAPTVPVFNPASKGCQDARMSIESIVDNLSA